MAKKVKQASKKGSTAKAGAKGTPKKGAKTAKPAAKAKGR